jgi:ankyrin repeat protein
VFVLCLHVHASSYLATVCAQSYIVSLSLSLSFFFNFLLTSHYSVLHWATDRGHTHLVKMLLSDYKADPNIADSDEQTPLHYAAICDEIEIAQILVRHGADASLLDEDEVEDELLDALKALA